jgi:hypothetical protein
MPGPFIHMSSMRNAALRLARGRYEVRGSDRIDPSWTGVDIRQVGNLLQEYRNFASLGAIGPDLFFFLPDFRNEHGINISSVLVTVLNFLEGLYKAIDPYISKWEHYLGPISEDTAEEMSRLTGGLSETVGDISGELSGILITALEDFVVQQEDPNRNRRTATQKRAGLVWAADGDVSRRRVVDVAPDSRVRGCDAHARGAAAFRRTGRRIATWLGVIPEQGLEGG